VPRAAGRRAELAPTHDLGAEADPMTFGERVVDADAATGLADHRAPEPGGEHPLVQAFPGVAERLVDGEAVAGPEPVERDREVVDADLGHGCLPGESSCELQLVVGNLRTSSGRL